MSRVDGEAHAAHRWDRCRNLRYFPQLCRSTDQSGFEFGSGYRSDRGLRQGGTESVFGCLYRLHPFRGERSLGRGGGPQSLPAGHGCFPLVPQGQGGVLLQTHSGSLHLGSSHQNGPARRQADLRQRESGGKPHRPDSPQSLTTGAHPGTGDPTGEAIRFGKGFRPRNGSPTTSATPRIWICFTDHPCATPWMVPSILAVPGSKTVFYRSRGQETARSRIPPSKPSRRLTGTVCPSFLMISRRWRMTGTMRQESPHPPKRRLGRSYQY